MNIAIWHMTCGRLMHVALALLLPTHSLPGNHSMNIKTTVTRFLHDERGTSMAEYALLVGVVAVFLVAALTTFRGKIASAFGAAGNAIN